MIRCIVSFVAGALLVGCTIPTPNRLLGLLSSEIRGDYEVSELPAMHQDDLLALLYLRHSPVICEAKSLELNREPIYDEIGRRRMMTPVETWHFQRRASCDWPSLFMNSDRLEELAGQPDRTEFKDGVELLVYETKLAGNRYSVFDRRIVCLDNARVRGYVVNVTINSQVIERSRVNGSRSCDQLLPLLK